MIKPEKERKMKFETEKRVLCIPTIAWEASDEFEFWRGIG